MLKYKKVFKENKKIICSLLVSLIITIAFSFWYIVRGEPFEWISITPISQPDLLSRVVLSSLTFITVGAFLYHIARLWQFLKFICKDIFNSWPLYNFVKSVVWIALVFFTGFYLVPIIVNWINFIISFFYNFFSLILFLSPLFGVFVVSFLIIIFFLKKKNY